jgi:mono/diheme cytochrome c family protein
MDTNANSPVSCACEDSGGRHESKAHSSAICGFASFASFAATCSAFAKDDSHQDRGEQIYMQSRCFACHGQLGTGGFGDRLAGDRMLAIQPFVIAQILLGRGKMPAFADRLSDQDIAAVANYVRNDWGNKFGPVSAGDVAAVRGLLAKASQQVETASSPQK